jgi:hypothetical protein
MIGSIDQVEAQTNPIRICGEESDRNRPDSMQPYVQVVTS